ncbi:hypothetical protein BN2497_3989 [Janthinobacterium sp. CG23_2]|nr:hypothetical protein BN2497_3989 [Janthinobacterium sp. CG23_2]CUU28392.1 hypothetical protein BN3177_3989 [Janthinobacterium sp. CG23_2]
MIPKSDTDIGHHSRNFPLPSQNRCGAIRAYAGSNASVGAGRRSVNSYHISYIRHLI